jgi:hypothetical protein
MQVPREGKLKDSEKDGGDKNEKSGGHKGMFEKSGGHIKGNYYNSEEKGNSGESSSHDESSGEGSDNNSDTSNDTNSNHRYGCGKVKRACGNLARDVKDAAIGVASTALTRLSQMRSTVGGFLALVGGEDQSHEREDHVDLMRSYNGSTVARGRRGRKFKEGKFKEGKFAEENEEENLHDNIGDDGMLEKLDLHDMVDTRDIYNPLHASEDNSGIDSGKKSLARISEVNSSKEDSPQGSVRSRGSRSGISE